MACPLLTELSVATVMASVVVLFVIIVHATKVVLTVILVMVMGVACNRVDADGC
jgi:hypothetical protein